jgi:hypothetical protein
MTIATYTSSMNNARALHTATLLTNGNVLVANGQNYPGQLASAELYNPSTAKWTLTGSTPTTGYYSTALLQNGQVLAIEGGSNSTSAALYTP